MINRVLIFGYFGCGNLGDEANLNQLVHWIREINPQIQLTVISANPAETTRDFKVATVNKFNLFGIIRRIHQTDLLIGGAGNLFQDLSSKRSLFYYSALIILAWIFKLKVFLYAQGFGPVRSAIGKKIAKWAISRVHVITIRDLFSESVLAALKVSGPKIYPAADPLLLNESLPADEVREFWNGFVQSRNKIGVIIQEYPLIGHDFWEQLLISLKMDGVEPYLISLQARDFIFQHILAKRNGMKVISIENNWKRLLRIIGGLDLVISTRLHGLVAAVVQGINCIGLAVDPKIKGFCLQHGIKYVSITAKMTPISLGNQLIACAKQTSIQPDSGHLQPAAWKAQALENRIILQKVIRGEL